MVLLSIFFTRIRSTEDVSRLFFIHFVTPCLLFHLAVKILLQIFLYEGAGINTPSSVGCISLQNASRTALCYATNTIK